SSTPHWFVTCSCGWGREASSQWGANAGSRLHQQLAEVGTEHVTQTEPPGRGRTGEQLTLGYAARLRARCCIFRLRSRVGLLYPIRDRAPDTVARRMSGQRSPRAGHVVLGLVAVDPLPAND